MTGAPPADDFELSVYRSRWSADCFLTQLAEPVLVEWLRMGRIRRFATKEVLIEEGDQEACVFLLLSGCVKVATHLTAEHDALLAIRSGGDVVGELAALSNGTRSAIVKACGRDPVVACELTSDQTMAVLTRHPDVTLALTKSIIDKFRSATRRRIDYTTRPPKVCLARAMVDLVTQHGHRLGDTSYLITIELTHLELGTLVGVHESTAQRALRDMRELGVVNTSGRRPVVNDLAALREIAELPDPNPGK